MTTSSVCPCSSSSNTVCRLRGSGTASGSWPACWSMALRLVAVVLVCCASLWMVTEALPQSLPLPPTPQQHMASDDGATSTTPRLQALVEEEDVMTSCSRDVSAKMQGTIRAPGDGGYRIRIIGLQQPTYAPGQVYTVELGGTYAGQQLMGFYLVAVPRYAQDESTEMGTFQHFDGGITAFDVTCPHQVTNATATPLSAISVLWTAPLSGTGCLEFRATVVAGEQTWYSDGGALTLVLCEQTGSVPTVNNDLDPGTNKVEVARAANDAGSSKTRRRRKRHQGGEGQVGACCACGIAKYQLIFESLWPGNGAQRTDLPNTISHWSSTMGASHSDHYSLWRYGDYASRGVQELCELGHVQALERELRLNGDNMRTVVKTPAIWWTEEARLHQSRWTQFSADHRNHVLSTLTRLGPSPDWCVGVSALDLCLPNCTWIQNLSVDLYLWDAGTNDAATFVAPHVRSSPSKTITRLTNTVALPMAATSALLTEPVAALHLARIPDKYSGYSARCDESQPADNKPPSPSSTADVVTTTRSSIVTPVEAAGGKCQVSEWSTWSRCSVTCGVGSSVRKRTRTSGTRLTCAHLPMMEAITCYADVAQCPDQQQLDDCAVTEWSEWSACSTSCGKGVRERRRHYVVVGHSSQCNRVTEERESCDTDTAQCMRLMAAKNFSAICRLPAESGPCRSGALRWHFDAQLHMCMPFSYGGCMGNDNRFQTELECMDICERAIGVRVDDDRGRSSSSFPSTVFPDEYRRVRPPQPTTAASRATGSGKRKSLTTTSSVKGGQQQQQPSTTSSTTNAARASPAAVTYLTTKSTPVAGSTTVSSTGGKSNATPKAGQSQGQGQPVDCQVSGWRPWSVCSSPCGVASYKYRRRTVIRPASNGGKACPKSLTMRKQCHVPPCPKRNAAAHNRTKAVPLAKPKGLSCAVSKWSSWSVCSATCGPESYKYKRRSLLDGANRTTITMASTVCRKQLERKKRCHVPPCIPADCDMSEWSGWTSCTATCGPDSVQERVRRPLAQLPVSGGQSRSGSQPTVVAPGCELLVERRYCNLPPCHQKPIRRRKPGKKASTYHLVASSEHS